MVIDNYGNSYVTGVSVNPGTSWDISTIKYNSSGVQQWVAIYSGPRSVPDGGNSIAVDLSGNVYVTGEVDGNTNFQDYITIKYNPMGVQQWAVRYNGPGNYSDEAFLISVDKSGNAYVSGRSISNLRYDYCTIKYSGSGVEQWVARYDGPLHWNDQPYQLRLDELSNVYVTGFIDDSSNSKNFGTIKYNSSGVQQWAAIYNGPANASDEARSLEIDNSGNVFVTGESKGNGSDFDIATIKYDSNGTQIWVARYNGPGNYLDRGNAIGISQQNDIYVAGWSYGNGTLADYVSIKYNPSGIQQWVQRYNGPGNDIEYTSPPNSLAIDFSDNIYITGWSKGLNSQYDYCTIKYNSSGEQIWLSRYNGPGNNNDYGVVVAVDTFNNVYAFGTSRDSSNSDDYCLIKYSLLVSIKPISNEIPSQFSLSQNYPNPFNPATKINFDIPRDARRETRDVKLIVYDALGKEVATLVNQKLSQGSYEVEFNGANFPSGIYYYKLIIDSFGEAGSFSEVKKMILLK